MGTMTTLPRGGAFTRQDLGSMPDDGRRYELLDGTLVVTPSPSRRHQDVVASLFRVLDRSCPEHLVVRFAPLDVVLDEDTVLQPDLLVARGDEYHAGDVPLHPSLAVEVSSPSTQLVDRTVKRARYQAAGCSSYWVVDPDAPSLTVWEIENRQYVERAYVAGDETASLTAPFEVTITPSALLD